jgi:hypothetical protein
VPPLLAKSWGQETGGQEQLARDRESQERMGGVWRLRSEQASYAFFQHNNFVFYSGGAGFSCQ